MNKWSPDFDPAQDVPTAVLVWVRLPHLPLHCWSQNSLQSIGNALGRYIDQAPRKDQYSYAHICIEVDLQVRVPKAIKLSVVDSTHIQELDYEQLPFKCRHCHEYGHFARYCKKKMRRHQRKKKANNGNKQRKQQVTGRTTKLKLKRQRIKQGKKVQAIKTLEAGKPLALWRTKIPLNLSSHLQILQRQSEKIFLS